MKNLKELLENLISTGNFQPGNLVGSRMPDGALASPGQGPQKQKGKWKIKKKAKPVALKNRVMDIQKQAIPFAINPSEWDKK